MINNIPHCWLRHQYERHSDDLRKEKEKKCEGTKKNGKKYEGTKNKIRDKSAIPKKCKICNTQKSAMFQLNYSDFRSIKKF